MSFVPCEGVNVPPSTGRLCGDEGILLHHEHTVTDGRTAVAIAGRRKEGPRRLIPIG